MCILFWRKKKRHVESNTVAYKPNHVESTIGIDKQVYAESNTGVNKPVHIEKKSNFSKHETYVIEEVPVVISEDEKKVKIQKYHVSQNKDKEAEFFMKWRVRKEGSDKTIQFFDTQKIAIDFAQDLADKSGSTVVIHKLDGSIRKQDYTKK